MLVLRGFKLLMDFTACCLIFCTKELERHKWFFCPCALDKDLCPFLWSWSQGPQRSSCRDTRKTEGNNWGQITAILNKDLWKTVPKECYRTSLVGRKSETRPAEGLPDTGKSQGPGQEQDARRNKIVDVRGS